MMHGGRMGRMAALPTGKAAETGKTLRRLLGYARPFWLQIGAVLILVVANALLSLADPYLIGLAVDQFIVAGDRAGLARTMFLLLAVYVGTWATNASSFYVMTIVAQKLLCWMRNDIFQHIQTLALDFFDRHDSGDLMSRLVNDVDVINNVLNMGIVRTAQSVLTLVGVAAAMLALNVRLALVSLAVLPFMALATFVFSSRALVAFRETRKTIGEVSAELEEEIAGVRVTQAFSRENANIARFDQINAANRDANVSAESIIAAFSPTLDVLSTVAVAIVAGYGGYLALHGLVTVGVIVAFLSYVRRLYMPIRSLTQLWTQLQSAVAGAERIFQLLDTRLEIVNDPDARDIPTIEGRVEFDHVSFSYKPGEPVLEDVSLVAEPGQTVALVGPTGAGKTTIVNLLARFYDVQEGAVRVDGYDVRQVTQESLRRQMGVVLQDTFLFADTVMENIRYGRLDASDEEVVEAARLANADDFISRLPEGYQTPLTERGSNLSQGQRQLIAIARAILANPRILILDEATSSVDTRTERLIQSALGRLLRRRTSFVIAHRLSTIRNADQVLVIQDGRIVERGTHSDLLAQEGVYYSLYMSQFKREEAGGDGRRATAAQRMPALAR
jgi:ATP-binding cassette subfamily B multidrug efflux pump